MSSLIINMKPPRIALLLLVVSSVLHYAIYGASILSHGCWLCCMFLAIIGFGVMIWAWALFKKEQTAICPTSTASFLVSDGPYRFTRNPMYLGMALMLSGVAWGMGSPVIALTPLAFLLIIQFVFIPYEEQRLQEIFGSQYAEYSSRVRRWL